MENKNYKLLLGKGIPCKVNMHNHSHVSDSLITAPELKKLYMEEGGYAGIAYTDHDVIVSHRDLIDDKFVAFT